MADSGSSSQDREALSGLRRIYGRGQLSEKNAEADPLRQLSKWLQEAQDTQSLDPAAMALATVDSRGYPDVRMVLLKGLDDRGLVFYGSKDSAKGLELAENAAVAMVLFWPELERQVRVRAQAEPLDVAEVEAYFRTRPRGSQISAWASPQSQPLRDRAELEEKFEGAVEKFGGLEGSDPVPLPPRWGGWRAVPFEVELWQGRPDRLHDRLQYSRDCDGKWQMRRVAP